MAQGDQELPYPTYRVPVHSEKVVLAFGCVIGLLTLAGIVSQFFVHVLGRDTVFGLVPLFSLDREANIPTWYAGCSILVCAALLFLIAAATKSEGDRVWRDWRLLAVVFVLMSLDELASIHEWSVGPLRTLLKAEGPFHFTWVVPGILFVVYVLFRLRRFLVGLDTSFRNRLLLAGALYMGGAVGLEMVGGAYLSRYERDAVYSALTIVEEFLEMIGILLLLRALLYYLRDHIMHIDLHFSSRSA